MPGATRRAAAIFVPERWLSKNRRSQLGNAELTYGSYSRARYRVI